jgi:hypothetical protein
MSVLLRILLLCSAMAVCAAEGAPSTIWKCAGDGGTVVYQDVPCPTGKELRNLTVEPPSLSVVPGAPVPSGKPSQGAAPRSDRAAPVERKKASNGNAVNRKFIQIGMSEAEVIQRIGKPDVDAKNRHGGHQWSYLPKEGDPNTITTVTLINGKVSDVERKVVH